MRISANWKSSCQSEKCGQTGIGVNLGRRKDFKGGERRPKTVKPICQNEFLMRK